VAALSQKALAGVIAHELGHCRAGDTGLARWTGRCGQGISALEELYTQQLAHNINPLTWLVRLYHLVFLVFFFANSRRQEFAADRHEVERVGAVNAGATTVLLEVLGAIKGTDLASVAESFIKFNMPLEDLFREQVRRIVSASFPDWEDAMKKALRTRTGWFDSHPRLKDRLAAVGVSPGKALNRALRFSGKPATTLFADWSIVEAVLSRMIVEIVRELYWARQQDIEEARAIMLGPRR
jgi:Zn-dependent protease with chaperone function